MALGYCILDDLASKLMVVATLQIVDH